MPYNGTASALRKTSGPFLGEDGNGDLMKAILLVLTLSLLFVTASALAEETQAQLPQSEERLESRGQLALRATSPDAELGTKGEKIGWIREGENVRVMSLKQVATVLGFEVWVEVRAEDGKRGWVYDGMTADVLQGRGSLAKVDTASSNLLIAKAN